MAVDITNTNYVKFVRGSIAAFNKLAEKHSDTLYFVYENTDAQTGSLYLGTKLISGGVASLSQIQDIVLDTVKDGDLLVYNESQKKWVATSISQALNIPVMEGASNDKDGREGLVPTPSIGEQDLFLRGDGSWSTITPVALNINESIFDFTVAGDLTLKDFASAKLNSVPTKTGNGLEWIETYSKDEINSLINNIPSLTRTIIDSTDEIDLTTEECFHYIYMVPTSTEEGNKYEEYIVIADGESKIIEKIGGVSSTIDLEGYVTTVTFEQFTDAVGNLNELVKYTEEATLVDQVNYLTDRMTWKEISETETN